MVNISINENAMKHDPLADAMVRLKGLASSNPSLSLSGLIQAVDKEGPAFAAALLTLPFLQPIPLFGLSTPAGLTIALSGIGIFLQKPVYLPKRLGVVQLKSETVLKMSEFLLAFQKKINPYIKNDSFVQSQFSFRFLGTFIAIHGVLLALPLPIPFSNAMPAWMCFPRRPVSSVFKPSTVLARRYDGRAQRRLLAKPGGRRNAWGLALAGRTNEQFFQTRPSPIL
jgi:hypothetical protein